MTWSNASVQNETAKGRAFCRNQEAQSLLAFSRAV
jgi:hypothetical protein